MAYSYFSYNGEIRPIDQAVVPLGSVEYSYGFGVYETIRLTKGKLYFVDEHCDRLMKSAEIIGLEHAFSPGFVEKAIKDLVQKNDIDTCNLKVLLIGGSTQETASLSILCLNPLFPDRKLYKHGAKCLTYNYERDFPAAKSLNMLSSYIAYRQAKQAGAYDALLVNRDGNITEGTRTNFFAIKDSTLYSPKAQDILPGVTRDHVLEVAKTEGFETVEKDIALSGIADYDGAFLTSTSSKIMPISQIDGHIWQALPPTTIKLMAGFDQFLKDYAA